MNKFTPGTFLSHVADGHLAKVAAVDGEFLSIDILTGDLAGTSDLITRDAAALRYAKSGMPSNKDKVPNTFIAQEDRVELRDLWKEYAEKTRDVRANAMKGETYDAASLAVAYKDFSSGLNAYVYELVHTLDKAGYDQAMANVANVVWDILFMRGKAYVEDKVGKVSKEFDDTFMNAIKTEYATIDNIESWILQRADEQSSRDVSKARKGKKKSKEDQSAEGAAYSQETSRVDARLGQLDEVNEQVGVLAEAVSECASFGKTSASDVFDTLVATALPQLLSYPVVPMQVSHLIAVAKPVDQVAIINSFADTASTFGAEVYSFFKGKADVEQLAPYLNYVWEGAGTSMALVPDSVKNDVATSLASMASAEDMQQKVKYEHAAEATFGGFAAEVSRFAEIARPTLHLLEDAAKASSPQDMLLNALKGLAERADLPSELDGKTQLAMKQMQSAKSLDSMLKALALFREPIVAEQNTQANLQVVFDKMLRREEQKTRPEKPEAPKPVALNIPILEGERILDIATGLWMETDFASGMYDVFATKLGVKREENLHEGLRRQLPDGVMAMITRGKYDPAQVQLYDEKAGAVFSVGGTHANVSFLKPEVISTLMSVSEEQKQADDLRKLVKSDPEVMALFEKAGALVPYGHVQLARRLNDRLSSSSSLTEFMWNIVRTAEDIISSKDKSAKDTTTVQEGKIGVNKVQPATLPSLSTSSSDLSILEDDKPGYTEYFYRLKDDILGFLSRGDTASAKEALSRAAHTDIPTMDKKAQDVKFKLEAQELVRIPRTQLVERKQLTHMDNKMGKESVRAMQRIVDGLIGTLAMSKAKYSHLTVGAEHMSNMLNTEYLRQGQPVRVNGQSTVHLVVSRDDKDPFKYFLIPESSVNSHDRVELVTASLAEITPLKLYAVSEGDVLEIAGGLAKVTNADSKDIGVVQVVFQGTTEAVNYPLENTKVAYTIRPPYKLVQCTHDGGYITPEDQINCPFHDATGHLSTTVAGYKPRIVTASVKVDDIVTEPENEKAARDKYEVEVLTAALDRISFDQATPEAPKAEIEEDFEAELEIGAHVKKFGSTTVGTLLGKRNACWTVAWEGGKQENCWPIELITVKENA